MLWIIQRPSLRRAVAEPVRQVLLAPLAVVGGGVPGSELGVVHHRLVRLDEGVAEPLLQGPTGQGNRTLTR